MKRELIQFSEGSNRPATINGAGCLWNGDVMSFPARQLSISSPKRFKNFGNRVRLAGPARDRSDFGLRPIPLAKYQRLINLSVHRGSTVAGVLSRPCCLTRILVATRFLMNEKRVQRGGSTGSDRDRAFNAQGPRSSIGSPNLSIGIRCRSRSRFETTKTSGVLRHEFLGTLLRNK